MIFSRVSSTIAYIVFSILLAGLDTTDAAPQNSDAAVAVPKCATFTATQESTKHWSNKVAGIAIPGYDGSILQKDGTIQLKDSLLPGGNPVIIIKQSPLRIEHLGDKDGKKFVISLDFGRWTQQNFYFWIDSGMSCSGADIDLYERYRLKHKNWMPSTVHYYQYV